MNNRWGALLIATLLLGLASVSVQGQTEVQTPSNQVHTRLDGGGGLLMSGGSTWPLGRLSVVRGAWRADLDIWVAEGFTKTFLMPTMRVDFALEQNRVHLGLAPVIGVEKGRLGLREFLYLKAGIDLPFADLGLEAFTEAIFLVDEYGLSPFPGGFTAGLIWSL